MYTIDDIEKGADGYKLLANKRDPMYEDLLRAIRITKSFIKTRGLIYYGGMAIDSALRLVGDKIYDDAALTIPDLDVYSMNHVKDAYDLVDLLYTEGYHSCRAITGQYIKIMRVDIGLNHFIIDIAYKPSFLFKNIPTLIYDGSLIVHPHYQYIDIHTSLSQPYANPPKEVVLQRWKKDIDRFNLLHKYYPIVSVDPIISPTSQSNSYQFPAQWLSHAIPYGLTAFLFYADFLKVGQYQNSVVMSKGVKGSVDITLNGLIEPITLISHQPVKFIEDHGISKYEQYRSLGGLIPGYYKCYTKHGLLHLYDSSALLIGYQSIPFKTINRSSINSTDKTIRLVCVQYILHYLAIMSYIHENKAIYKYYYASLLGMVRGATNDDNILDHVLGLTVKVYGFDNINLSTKFHLARINAAITGESIPAIPRSYLPAKVALNLDGTRVRPEWDYNRSEWFLLDGSKVDNPNIVKGKFGNDLV